MANLQAAVLNDANLDEAILTNADLTGAALSSVSFGVWNEIVGIPKKLPPGWTLINGTLAPKGLE